MARRGFVFLRSPAEPVQQASRTGGSLVENAQASTRTPARAPGDAMPTLLGAGVTEGSTAAHSARREMAEAETIRGDLYEDLERNRLRAAVERVAVLLAQLLHVLGPAVVSQRGPSPAEEVAGGLRSRVRPQVILLGLVSRESELVAPR